MKKTILVVVIPLLMISALFTVKLRNLEPADNEGGYQRGHIMTTDTNGKWRIDSTLSSGYIDTMHDQLYINVPNDLSDSMTIIRDLVADTAAAIRGDFPSGGGGGGDGIGAVYISASAASSYATVSTIPSVYDLVRLTTDTNYVIVAQQRWVGTSGGDPGSTVIAFDFQPARERTITFIRARASAYAFQTDYSGVKSYFHNSGLISASMTTLSGVNSSSSYEVITFRCSVEWTHNSKPRWLIRRYTNNTWAQNLPT